MSVAVLGAADAGRLRLGRYLGYSALGHVLLLVFLLWSPGPEITLPKGVVMVDLGAELPGPAPLPSKPKPAVRKAEAKPKAVAKPPPPPPPPPKKTKATVLPKEAQKAPEKQKPEAKKPAPQRKELKPEEVPKQKEQSYEDVLEELREDDKPSYEDALEDLRKEAPDDAPPKSAGETSESSKGSSLPFGTPDGKPLSPEVAAWMRKVKVHVARVWRAPSQFSNDRLVTFFEVELDAMGNIVGSATLLRGSGNPWYDEEAQRALKRATPLPKPPRPGTYPIVFDSEE
jgi:TonB family protein